MGFKKLTTLACDGPCGLTIPEQEKAPAGWVKGMFNLYERLENGQKPTKKPRSIWLCPDCAERLYVLMNTAHFSLSEATHEDS